MQTQPNPAIQTHAAQSVAEADDDLLTTEEAAAQLRFNPLTLKNWRCTGAVDLPFVKVSGRVFYRRSTIQDAKLNGLKRKAAPSNMDGREAV